VPVTPVTPEKPIAPEETVVPEAGVKPVVPGPSSFSISDAHVIEATTGTRELMFRVQRSGDTSQSGSVRFSYQAEKSTTAQEDLSGELNGIVSFQPGESQQLVRLTVKADYLRETDEQVSVRLLEPVGGTLERAEGNGTIHEVDVTRLQAAYGMRDLNNELDVAAIRVRRSSDSEQRDIGFDAHGQLDREALLEFVGRGATDKGYVTRWYDQSGHSRDMTSENDSAQGVIVDAGKVVTRTDGPAGISFNAGRNGENANFMSASGPSATDWQSAVIYANVQTEGYTGEELFSTGDPDVGLSATYPSVPNMARFSVEPDSFEAPWASSNSDVWRPVNLAFEAHAGNSGAGTEALNHTDAKQAIFEGGRARASHGKLADQFTTASTWNLAMNSRGGDYQQTMYNEFLVYLAKDNSTPTPQNLIGSAQADVLTYSGEQDLIRIDGLAGNDTLYVAGKAMLDLTRFTGGVKHIEQFWLENGASDTLKLSGAMINALDVKALEIRLDANDRVEVDERVVPLNGLATHLAALSNGMTFKVTIAGEPVI
jgi:hypothetical protein